MKTDCWRSTTGRAVALAFAAASLGAGAQVAPSASGSVVTGHVTCADTQHPARFALVELLPATQDAEDGGFRGRGGRGIGRTDLDGDFSIADVSPGDYFVVAQLTGYVNQRAAVEAAVSAGTDPAGALAGVPEVHVGSTSGSADLVLQRGAVLAGSVAWDDGTPAAGVQVSVQPAPVSGVSSAGNGQTAGSPVNNGFLGLNAGQTDDRGRFRLSGLAAGTYVVRASVQAPAPQGGAGRPNRTLSLTVYAPDKPRKTDGATYKLSAGEERDDVAIVLGLRTLHSIAGEVSSTGAAVHSGTVTITDQTDATLNRTGVIAADGSFVVPYVPAGSYTLRVSASSQVQAGFGRGGGSGQGGGGTSFQPLQESVTVTDSDLTGVNLSVAPTVSSQ